MDKWKQIWNKDERINKIILESLVKADGFNSEQEVLLSMTEVEMKEKKYHQVRMGSMYGEEYKKKI